MKDRIKAYDKGEVMLESLIVYSVTIMLLFFLVSIFCVLFQRWNIQTIANETATRFAQTYRFKDADESTGYYTKDELKNVREYRYVFNKTELSYAAYVNAKSYATWRLANTTFTKNVVSPLIEVEVKNDALSRRHIEVKITGSYTVPFGEALSFFGFNTVTQYEVKTYADCVDIIDYVNTVNYVDYQTSLGQFGSKTIGLINAVLKLFNNIIN